jgi:hypothetical protein
MQMMQLVFKLLHLVAAEVRVPHQDNRLFHDIRVLYYTGVVKLKSQYMIAPNIMVYLVL